MTTIVAPPSNASKRQMGFNSAFKGLIYNSFMMRGQRNVNLCIQSLTLKLLTTTIVALPSNASKWQMGFNSAFKGLKQYFYVCTDCSYKPKIKVSLITQ